MDHPTVQRRLPSGWGAWLLVLTAALPTVVVIRMGWLVFSGSWASFVTQSQSKGMVLLGERWTNFWWASPAITTLLIVGLLPLLLLTVSLSINRPRVLVPSTAARHAATVVAVTTTLLGLIGAAGFVAQFTGLMPVEAWPSSGPSAQDAFAPFAAVTFAYVGLSVAATAALRPKLTDEQDEEGVESFVSVATGEGNPDGAGGAVRDGLGEEVAEDRAGTARPAAAVAKAGPGSRQPGVSPNLPVPSASDLDLYRRR